MRNRSKIKSMLLLLAAIVMLSASAGCGTSNSSDSTAYWGDGSSTTGTYTISGKIVSPVSLTPVQGMKCTLESLSGSAFYSSSGVTDSQGAYSFTGVPAGNCRLITKKDGNITDNSYFTVTRDMVINVMSLKQDEWTSVMGIEHPYDSTMAYVSAVIDHTGGGTPPIPTSKDLKETGREGVAVDLFSNSKSKGSGYKSRCYMDTNGKADWSATSTSTRGVALFYKVQPDDTYTMTAAKTGKTFNNVTNITPAKGEFTNYLMSQQAGVSALPINIVNNSGRTAWIMFTGTNLAVDNNNISIAPGSSQVFNLTSVSAGRIYISYDKALSSQDPDGANPSDPDYQTRFDKLELTYGCIMPGSNSGEVNLTAVDFFSIPLILETSIQGTTIEHLTLAQNQTATTLNTALGNLVSQSSAAVIQSASTSETLRILSPCKAPSPYPTFDNLLNSLSGSTFTIAGTFFGTPLQNYNYTGSFSGNSITLSQNSTTMVITQDSLMYNQTDLTNHNGIYTCNGSYTINGVTHNVSDNDINAAVYRDLITGFNLGFVAPGSNNSSGWWSQSPFVGSYYNQYAQIIDNLYPGAYGFPFTDRYREVLANLGNNSSGGIDGVTVTILNDTTSPPPFSFNGTVNPQGPGDTTFSMSIDAGASNTNFASTQFTFNTQTYTGGNSYLWPTTLQPQFPPPATSASINSIPAVEGLNVYDLQFSQVRSYQVIVNVSGGQVQWAAISGGGGSTWTSPVLYIGSVLD